MTDVVFVQRVPVSPEHSDIFLQPKIEIGEIVLTLHLLYHSHISYSIRSLSTQWTELERKNSGNNQSTLMQLLFSFDRGMGVEKTLMQTLVSQQLSSTLILVWPGICS